MSGKFQTYYITVCKRTTESLEGVIVPLQDGTHTWCNKAKWVGCWILFFYVAMYCSSTQQYFAKKLKFDISSWNWEVERSQDNKKQEIILYGCPLHHYSLVWSHQGCKSQKSKISWKCPCKEHFLFFYTSQKVYSGNSLQTWIPDSNLASSHHSHNNTLKNMQNGYHLEVGQRLKSWHDWRWFSVG